MTKLPSLPHPEEATGGLSRRASLAALAMGAIPPVLGSHGEARSALTGQGGIGAAVGGGGARPGPAKNLLDALTAHERADAASGSPTVDLTAKINGFLAAHPDVEIPGGTFLVDHLDIPATLTSLRGLGKSTLTFKRRTGAAGAMFRCSDARNSHALIEGVYLIGNGASGETCGFDLTGFSYATFVNCRARQFRLDGWYSKGLITPTNRQMSNNTFINCIGNDNGRDGIRMEGESPLRYENTANIFIGGEFSGNAGKGIHGDVCESTQFYGTCTQANSGRDIYFNSRFGVFHGYVESGAKGVEMGPRSFGCRVAVRSSYPWWNTFIDHGEANHLSVMGEVVPERHLFSNPCFADWTGSAPAGITLKDAPAVSSYPDPGSPFGAGLQLRIDANFQGLIFSLLAPGAELAGRWVTLLIEADTSGVVDPLEMRIYALDGATPNSRSGEFAIEPLAVTGSGRVRTMIHDVRFTTPIRGNPSVIWFPAYRGVRSGGNVIRIRSARIVLGQSSIVGWPIADQARTPSATMAELKVARMGINVHRKKAGRTVYDSTSGKLRFALSEKPTGAWRATDGSDDLIPA